MPDPVSAPRILIADDDPNVRDILSEILTGHGAVVTAVTDGQAAVHEAMLSPYDLCILDFEMPAMTGVEACPQIRQSAVTKSMPILFMTGRSDEQSISQAFTAGASDYLCKPVHPTLLWMRVKNLLTLAKLEKEGENLSDVLKAAGEPPKE